MKKYLEIVTNKWYKGSTRPFIEFVIDKIETFWDQKNIFIVEAPTGYGKSTISATIALYSLENELKTIIVFPTRSLLEDQYSKFRRLIPRNILGKRYMLNPDSPYLLKPVTLTTIDTLSLQIFGIPPEDLDKVIKAGFWDGTLTRSIGHYMFSWGIYALSNLILDEVHLLADSTKSLNFLFVLIENVINNNQKMILMSATIPNALQEIFVNNLSDYYLNKMIFLNFSKNKLINKVSTFNYYDRMFILQRLKKRYNIEVMSVQKYDKNDLIMNYILSNIEKFSKIAVIFNTVLDAISFYLYLSDHNVFRKFDGILLLHSRYNEEDRELLAKKLSDIRHKESYLVISTQVIEAGVDISSNLFITEIAPANSLIQRLGRFLRYDENEGSICIWYEVDDEGNLLNWKGKYKVYDWLVTQKTLEILLSIKNELNIHVPDSYSSESGYRYLLDQVYSPDDYNINLKEINELSCILLNLEKSPLLAIRKFFELEASFIREGIIIPVIPESKVNLEKISEREIFKKIVPLAYSTFKNMVNKEKIKGYIKTVNGKIFFEETNLKKELFSTRRFIEYIFRNNIIAFVTDTEYNKLLGLIFGG